MTIYIYALYDETGNVLRVGQTQRYIKDTWKLKGVTYRCEVLASTNDPIEAAKLQKEHYETFVSTGHKVQQKVPSLNPVRRGHQAWNKGMKGTKYKTKYQRLFEQINSQFDDIQRSLAELAAQVRHLINDSLSKK